MLAPLGGLLTVINRYDGLYQTTIHQQIGDKFRMTHAHFVIDFFCVEDKPQHRAAIEDVLAGAQGGEIEQHRIDRPQLSARDAFGEKPDHRVGDRTREKLRNLLCDTRG